MRIPTLPLVVGFLVVAAASLVALVRFGDLERFVSTAGQAEPWWILVALGLQILTYVATGEVWNVATRMAGHPLRPALLSRLALERHTVDQCVPSAGVAGHMGTLQALRHFGVPTPVAMEAVLVDLVSHYAAYSVAAIVAFSMFSSRRDTPPAVALTLGVFVAIAIVVLTVAVLFLRNRDLIRRLPKRMSGWRWVSRLTGAVSRISADRVLDVRVVLESSLFQLAVFLLDAATLWATLRSVGVHLSFPLVFMAFVIALIAGTVSFIPGGIGIFEAGLVAILLGSGAPLEGAIAGIFLFRGLSLWLPLVPGLMVTHRDLVSTASGEGFRTPRKGNDDGG